MEPKRETLGTVLFKRAFERKGWTDRDAARVLGKNINMSFLRNGRGVSLATAVLLRDRLDIPVDAWLKPAPKPRARRTTGATAA